MFFTFIYMLFYGCNPDVRINCRDDLIFQVTTPQSTRPSAIKKSREVIRMFLSPHQEKYFGVLLLIWVVEVGCTDCP